MTTSVEDTGICRQKKVDKKPNSVMPKIRMQYRGDDWAAERHSVMGERSEHYRRVGCVAVGWLSNLSTCFRQRV